MPQIREDQARQAALISHVVSDVLSDPQMGALALAKSKLTLAAFSRAQEFEADGIGVGISARAGFDPYGASRFLADMQRNADLKTAGSDKRAHPTFSPPIRQRPTGSKSRSPMRGSSAVPAPANAIATEYLGDINGMVYGEDPSEGFVRGRRFLHPKLGFTFLGAARIYPRQYRAGGARPQRRRRSDAARRGQRAGRTDAARLT